MAYTPTNWEESTTTLGPTNMNHIEQGIAEAHEKLEPTALAEALLNIFRPVGTYYETSDTSFNPNTAWGGTWVLETEGLVHVSAGTNYPVSANAQDGGEATHTLTTDEIPAHNHGQKSLTGMIACQSYSSGTPSGIVSSYYKNFNLKATTGANNFGTHNQTINASHTHDTVGGGQAHNNMQPYKNVNRWHRTA